MGIYDRDYYRDDTPGWWSDLKLNRVTLALLALICSLFLAELLTTERWQTEPGRVLAATAFEPNRVLGGEVWRGLTSHLVHQRAAFVQVMLFVFALYLFGTRAEQERGSLEFLAFCILSAVFIAGIKLIAYLAGLEVGTPTYGAGGLVAAILVMMAVSGPDHSIVIFVSMPLRVAAAIFIGLDLLGEFVSQSGPGCGRVAHLAGVVIGAAYALSRVRLTNFLRRQAPSRSVPRPALKLTTDSPIPYPPARTTTAPRAVETKLTRSLDEHLEAKLDQVLEKVARDGRASLTEDEQATLQRASELFKQRRKQ